MAKGFGAVLLLVLLVQLRCRGCSLHIQEESNRTRRTKAAFIEETAKSSTSPCLTLITQSSGKLSFCVCYCLFKSKDDWSQL